MLSPAKALANELSKNRVDLIKEILLAPAQFASFWGFNRKYSLYNQAFLSSQMRRRRIPLGPVNSFETWRAEGNPVVSGQQALYVVAPRDVRSTSTSEEGSPVIRFKLTPVFALAQTQDPTPKMPGPLPPVDLSRLGYTGPLNTLDDWFTFIYSLVPSRPRPNSEYERTLITLLVLISFAGGLVSQAPQLQPFIDGALEYLEVMPKEVQVMKEAQRILRELFD